MTQQVRPVRILKDRMIGAIGLAALLALLIGTTARFIPSETPLGPLVRVFDSLAPALFVMAAGLAILVVLLGARRLGGVLVAGALAASGWLYSDHRALSLPVLPDEPVDLRVLFFNVLYTNGAFGDRIVTAIFEEDPDVVVIAEAEAIYPALRRLQTRYAVHTPCAFDECGLLLATKMQPKRAWRLSLSEVFTPRYGVVEIVTETGKSAFVVGNHLVKPWLSGLSEPEHGMLAAQYDWLSGPVVVVGDFNAAPWSRPLQVLLDHTGFFALRRPPATWPVSAGRFGVPIDQVLVHGGARVVQAQRFGENLGSNHVGLVVDVALPDSP